MMLDHAPLLPTSPPSYAPTRGSTASTRRATPPPTAPSPRHSSTRCFSTSRRAVAEGNVRSRRRSSRARRTAPSRPRRGRRPRSSASSPPSVPTFSPSGGRSRCRGRRTPPTPTSPSPRSARSSRSTRVRRAPPPPPLAVRVGGAARAPVRARPAAPPAAPHAAAARRRAPRRFHVAGPRRVAAAALSLRSEPLYLDGLRLLLFVVDNHNCVHDGEVSMTSSAPAAAAAATEALLARLAAVWSHENTHGGSAAAAAAAVAPPPTVAASSDGTSAPRRACGASAPQGPRVRARGERALPRALARGGRGAGGGILGRLAPNNQLVICALFARALGVLEGDDAAAPAAISFLERCGSALADRITDAFKGEEKKGARRPSLGGKSARRPSFGSSRSAGFFGGLLERAASAVAVGGASGHSRQPSGRRRARGRAPTTTARTRWRRRRRRRSRSTSASSRRSRSSSRHAPTLRCASSGNGSRRRTRRPRWRAARRRGAPHPRGGAAPRAGAATDAPRHRPPVCAVGVHAGAVLGARARGGPPLPLVRRQSGEGGGGAPGRDGVARAARHAAVDLQPALARRR